jgi:CYTH domain-containing protein
MSDVHENEIKIVLRSNSDLADALAQMHIKENAQYQHITQGYLDPHTRIRRIVDGELAFHFLTYKKRLPNNENLEIEGSITASVFEHAWTYTHERVSKLRYKLKHDGLQWDIDFYHWSRPYFVLAEVEMPSGSKVYDVPPILAPHVHFIVPREDKRFAARALSDETHVEALARELNLI